VIVSGVDSRLLGSLGIDGQILHTPGHTHDSMSIVLADGRAFVGDLAMTLLSFCGCRSRPIYVTDWTRSTEAGRSSSIMARGSSTPATPGARSAPITCSRR